MQIKLFGKQLFEASKGYGGIIYNTAVDSLKKSEFLIDFYRDTGGNMPSIYESISDSVTITAINGTPVGKKGKKTKPAPKPQPKEEITPKGVYQLKMLNDLSFKIKADPAYVDEQLETFKEKLGMIKTKEFDMNRGTVEIGSMIMRLENRKKYSQFKGFYDEFPYTSTQKISELVKEHGHLRLGEVSQFLADMPKEAVDVMKRYTEQTKKLCEKKPVFYIIAKKKDFEKTEKRRDPILLAQSPFGHFWQILGAWDEEMLLIEEL